MIYLITAVNFQHFFFVVVVLFLHGGHSPHFNYHADVNGIVFPHRTDLFIFPLCLTEAAGAPAPSTLMDTNQSLQL